MLNKKPEINGSSMADIAFLLLIFFLVTTTINVDTGIGMVLPPATDETPPPIHKRNLMNILVNTEGKILMDNELVKVEEIRSRLKEFIDNNGVNPELSDSPDKAIISLKTQRQTPYKIYIDMLDEVMGAYKELRDEASIGMHGREYSKLKKDSPEQKFIKSMYAKKISIADSEEI